MLPGNRSEQTPATSTDQMWHKSIHEGTRQNCVPKPRMEKQSVWSRHQGCSEQQRAGKGRRTSHLFTKPWRARYVFSACAVDHFKILKQKRQAGGYFLDLCHLVFRKQFGHQILPCQRGLWGFQKPVHLGPASQNPFLKGGEGSC